MKNEETLHCLIKALNFSPNGDVEGLQVESSGKFAQVVFGQETAAEVARSFTVGQTLDLTVEADSLSSNDSSSHSVYRFRSIQPSRGLRVPVVANSSQIAGVIVRLNYSRHGHANGVILDSGDFIHLKPDEMRRIDVSIGDWIEANGNVQPMELGGLVIDATSINGVLLNGTQLVSG